MLWTFSQEGSLGGIPQGHRTGNVASTLVSPKVIQSLKLSFSLKQGDSRTIAAGHSSARWRWPGVHPHSLVADLLLHVFRGLLLSQWCLQGSHKYPKRWFSCLEFSIRAMNWQAQCVLVAKCHCHKTPPHLALAESPVSWLSSEGLNTKQAGALPSSSMVFP